jgi:EPS-associated MarR family transcriptional regulator
MSHDQLDYQLLRELAKEPSASQRSLATRLGVSVGKVNYCLRAVIDKGWVKVGNFRRSDQKWAYTYLLTPRGVAAKAKLTRDFLRRKELEYELLHSEIRALQVELEAASTSLVDGSNGSGLTASFGPGSGLDDNEHKQ